MIGKTIALWLVALVVLPFTAPFSSCDVADVLRPSDHAAAMFSLPTDDAGDAAIVAAERVDAPALSLAQAVNLLDLPLELRPCAPGATPSAHGFDITSRTSILRL